jgi:uracil-DNA glycosylase family 4
VLAGGQNRFGDTIASALGWWVEAGVDTSISETPRNWLVPPARLAVVPSAQVTPALSALPADLSAFQRFLAEEDYVPGAPPASRRLTPFGEPDAGLMVIVDMPDTSDFQARALLGGECARLFDAMLAALGRTRETVYVAPLSPARIGAAGRIASDIAAPLAGLMRHHVALVRPRAIMLMGEETSRALLGMNRAEARGALRPVNHDGGTVSAIAVPHPRTLRQQPGLKADAWREMRRLIGVFAS